MTALDLPPTEDHSNPIRPASAAPNILPGRERLDPQFTTAREAQTTRPTNVDPASEAAPSGGSTTPPPTEGVATSQERPSVEGQHGPDHEVPNAQRGDVGVGSGVVQGQLSRANHVSAALDDPLLYLAAVSLDDLEKVRIAAENRLRQLTRDEVDADGEERGFGLTADNPQVRAQQSIVDGLSAMEHGAELALKRRLRQHPLHSWIKGTVGVGEKQAARLLAAVGDPYWNTLHDRPRTVSELWSYCGYRVVPAGHCPPDTPARSASGPQDTPADQTPNTTQRAGVGGEQSDGDPGQGPNDAQVTVAGVAVRRRKGQRANWSMIAKTRAYLIAESCIKQARSPYRAVYEARRQHTAVTRPEWTAGHSHNDALRIVAKEILKGLWRVARDVHEQEAAS